MKKILIVLNYYYPYVSGVSEHARLMAEEFVKSGYEVTVVTSNHANLREREKINGVNIIRTKVWFRISKGTISPSFIMKAIKQGRQADAINMHLPMLESGLLSLFMNKNKLFVTYHCDIHLEKSLLNRFIMKVMDISHSICCKRAKKILVTSLDYGKYSRITKKFLNKLINSGAPIKEYYPADKIENENKKRIGFCGRIVEEKGINVLIKAFEIIRKKREDVQLVIGGDYENVAGGSVYPGLKKYINEHNIEDITFLGKIPESEMPSFYTSLTVMVLPSTNSMEAFGTVQIEAMFCGTPVVASDLPGVKSIVMTTGMGEIAKRGNAQDLAEKIEKVMDNPQVYVKQRDMIEQIYGMEAIKKAYLKTMFE